jgi:hypothetical protein
VPEELPPPEPAEERPHSFSDASAPDEFVPEVAELLNQVLGLGAAVTRTVARATDPRQRGTGSGPLDEIVRNGASALANLVRLTVESLRVRTQPPAGTPGQEPGDQRPASRPGVRAGDTLRMPLFIENPSNGATGLMHFGAIDVVSPEGTGRPLGIAQVRCDPEILKIAARDFEKLTVFVDTDPTTVPGHHRVRVGVPDTAFITTVEFDVVTPDH